MGVYTIIAEKRFTFHYVSIKSFGHVVLFQNYLDLHSTMYLLNLADIAAVTDNKEFTFHYVSIKSKYHEGVLGKLTCIYIPLCIY